MPERVAVRPAEIDNSTEISVGGGGVIRDISRSHYVALDGLRGLAILTVVIFHFSLEHPNAHAADGIFLQLAELGWAGVDLFFVLSGFLITGILLETKSSPHYFRNFLARRFLRIWPLYYATLIVFFVIAPLVLDPMPDMLQSMNEEQAWFWLYAANWLFAREGGFGHTSGGYFWSLAVEEQFYLFWPVVVFYLSSRNLLKLCGLLFLVSSVGRVLLVLSGVSTGVVYVMTFTRLDPLVTGAALAVCLRTQTLSAEVRRVLPYLAGTSLLALAVVRLLDGHGFYTGRYMAMFGLSPLAILFGCLCAYSLQESVHPRWRAFLASRPMVAAGKYSYALYIVHVPIASLVAQVTIDRLPPSDDAAAYNLAFAMFFVLAALVSGVLAFLSWHLFEKHILKLKRFFEYSRKG